ncbi:MAG: hypothetical protein AB8B95_11150 [Pseudohongiellaceae bacterium]
MNSEEEQIFVTAIKNRLDQSAADLSPDLLANLNQARFAALAKTADRQSEDEFVQATQRELQQSETLPADVERRLNQIRRAAVAQHPKNRQSFTQEILKKLKFSIPRLNFSAGMMATACLTLTVGALFFGESAPPRSTPLDPELGLIASADELELYENLDFYLWLAENEDLN